MQPVRTVTSANKESGVFFMSLISTKEENGWIQIAHYATVMARQFPTYPY
jgi:hypothetical protein